MKPVVRYLRAVCVILLGWGMPGVSEARAQEPPVTSIEQTQEDPTRGSQNVDQVVAYAAADVLEAARRAATTYGCEIKKENAESFECTRSRHLGVFVGSGGERVTLRLQQVAGGTRVKIETGKGFVGRLGKKNWSSPVFNETLRLLEAR